MRFKLDQCPALSPYLPFSFAILNWFKIPPVQSASERIVVRHVSSLDGVARSFGSLGQGDILCALFYAINITDFQKLSGEI
jgi:hypothetical protein